MTDDSKTTRSIGGLTVDEERRWRTENVPRLLLHNFRVFEDRLLEDVHKLGFDNIRQLHFNVMRHLDANGTRMAVLAERLGITNGAMTQAVRVCELDGLVEIVPDELLVTLFGLFHKIEAEMMGILGNERFATLYSILSDLEAAFVAQKEGDEPHLARSEYPKRPFSAEKPPTNGAAEGND